MSADSDALRTTLLKKRLADASRHLAALEHAATKFGADFDLVAFELAWQSDEAEELTRAYGVQAGYENVINACVQIGQDLVALRRWAEGGTELSSVRVLRLLRENSVISAATHSALKNVQKHRSDVQHDYVSVQARDIHAAATDVMEHAPIMLQNAADEVRSKA